MCNTKACRLNGACGTVNHTCTAGTLTDMADTSTNYLWNCTGTNGGRTASCGQSKLPVAPTRLSAIAITGGKITLAWENNTNNETGFYIERSLRSNMAFSQVASLGAGITTYTDSGLSLGKRYYYRVQSYNAKGNSGYSNIAAAEAIR